MTVAVEFPFARVLCLGLADRVDRREHATRELTSLGVGPFSFIDAHGPRSAATRSALEQGRVAECPPCFRCGKDACACENRRLMPEQVATWLTHEAAWRDVATTGLTLICEDDIKFTERAWEAFEFIGQDSWTRKNLERHEPVLLRLGRALGPRHESLDAFRLTTKPTMANPCYALNEPMARLLLDRSESIHTTVDIFTHREVGSEVRHATLDPPLAYELSWSTGELRSDIRPKQVYLDRQRQLLANLDPSDARYHAVLKAIKAEEARFEAFVRYNSPNSK